MRNLLRSLAAEGRTIFVSSHLMSEMALTADHLIVIGKGRLIADASVADFLAQSANVFVRVRSPEADQLERVIADHGARVERAEDGALRVVGLTCAQVGSLAARSALELHELVLHEPTLEAAYMEVTQDAVEFSAATAPPGPGQASGAPSDAPVPAPDGHRGSR